MDKSNWVMTLNIEGISRKWLELILTIITAFITGVDGTVSGGFAEAKEGGEDEPQA